MTARTLAPRTANASTAHVEDNVHCLLQLLRNTVMAPTRTQSRADKARQILSGGALFREDSDDELGYDDLPWEWIYGDSSDAPVAQKSTPRKRNATSTAPGRRIVAARMGNFTCKLVRFPPRCVQSTSSWF